MFSRRHDTSNVSSSTTSVQIAFETDPTPHSCGYCNTDGSCTAGLYVSSSISLRRIRSSKCGYCNLESGKISFGKKMVLSK
ncbi:unnamed protein product [Adineta steineri]|uniref:Uncharacterized protein n=1 Tax=Adineta steineri TaxID=433720 RepID=A0A815U3H5_9BILA|nr:unnamed protein product [Adineta steineri]